MDSESSDRIQALLQQQLDWDYLLQTAPLHGMIPLLYTHLQAICPEAVPPDILERLQNHYQGNAQRNLFLTGELLKFLDLFQQHEIAAVPFKGPILAASIYGNLALRQFGDLDILIHKQDVIKAKELMLAQGYQLEMISLTKAQEAAYIQSQAEYNFWRAEGSSRINVELHWGIVPGDFARAIAPECFFSPLEPISLQQKTILTFTPENLLLILCIQRSKHLWERLDWICDIAEILRTHPQMNWQQVIEKATQLGCRRMLFLGLYLAKELLQAELSQVVWENVQTDPQVEAIALKVTQRLFQQNDNLPRAYIRSLFHLQTKERLQDKVEYCLRLGVTPTVTEWARLPLPNSLSFMYYLTRPLRLVRTHGMRPLKYLIAR
jgi:hypothetical protein